MTNLALESATRQFSLVRHAVDVGWAFVPEAAPPTIEGNKQLLGWLRGQRTIFVAAEKRSRNVFHVTVA